MDLTKKILEKKLLFLILKNSFFHFRIKISSFTLFFVLFMKDFLNCLTR